jgi:hypothetical protein
MGLAASGYNFLPWPFTSQPLYPCEESLVPTGEEAWWTPEPVWVLWSKEKSLAPAGNQTPPIQARAHCHTN